MKRALLAALVAATAALSLSATTALAKGSEGVTVAHYNVTYPWSVDADGTVHSVNCTGVHQTGKNFPGTATSGGQDSFTCTSTDGTPLAFLTAGEVLSLSTWNFGGCDLTVAPSCWLSDYFGQFGLNVAATSFSGSVSETG